LNLRDGGGAEFTPHDWSITLGRKGLMHGSTQVEQAVLAGTLYHEARHIEQAFRSACKLVRNDGGKTDEDQMRVRTVGALKIPLDIATMAVQTARGTPSPGGAADQQDATWLGSYLDKTNDRLQHEAALASGYFFRAERKYIEAFTDLIAIAGSVRQAIQNAIARGQTTRVALVTANPQDYADAKARLEQTSLGNSTKFLDAYQQIQLGFAAIKLYRRIPEEADAHDLGWRIETAYLGGNNPAQTYDAALTAGQTLFERKNLIVTVLDEATEEDPEIFAMTADRAVRDQLAPYPADLDPGALGQWQATVGAFVSAFHSLAFSRDNM
jgi:hypothetical protein